MTIMLHRVYCLLCFIYLTDSRVILNERYLKKPPTIEIIDSMIDGEDVDYDSEIYTLNFPTNDNSGDIKVIANFPKLAEIYIENYTLTEIPFFANLPTLWKLSLADNHLSEIKNGSLSTTSVQIVNFARNEINDIYNNAFGTNIIEVLLTCNRLTEVNQNWFSKPQNVEVLHLGGNRIKTIRCGTFENFNGLRRLELQNNGLVSLEDLSMFGVRKLNWLDLGNNLLTQIRPEVFGGNKTVVKYFSVKNNLLTYLHRDLLGRIDVDDIRIGGNPWICACKLLMRNWWRDNKKDNDSFADGVVCVLSSLKECDQKIDYRAFEEYYKIYNPRTNEKLC